MVTAFANGDRLFANGQLLDHSISEQLLSGISALR